jgi:pilus assembly protein CpaF
VSLGDRLHEVERGGSRPAPGQDTDEGTPATAQRAGTALFDRLEAAAAGSDGRPGELRPARFAGSGRRDPFGGLKTRVHRAIIDKLGSQLFGASLDDDLTATVRQAVEQELTADRTTPLTRDEHGRLTKEIVDDIVGYGPLEPLLDDESVTEVMVNGYDSIYVERRGKLEATQASFLDNGHLMRIIEKIVSQVGRRIDEASPMVDARLPDGSRVNAIIPPLALRGPALTIRKFSRDPFSIDDLVLFETVSQKAADFLAACVRGKLNILISGGAGTGKTTTMNALSAFIPNEERIVTIEDAAELQLQQEHVVTLEARPPNIEGQGEIRIRELVRNALRMRPDRIVVGEVRGAETLDMLQAMNTGHEGSLTTVHANSPRDALSRVETLVLTAGVDLPMRAIREQISSAFDLIVHLTRLVDGSRRVNHVTEVLRMESDVITLQDVFLARPPESEREASAFSLLGPLSYCGLQPHFLEKLATSGVRLPSDFFAEGSDWTARATGRLG